MEPFACLFAANISMQVKEIQYTRSTPCLQSCIGMEVNANGYNNH